MNPYPHDTLLPVSFNLWLCGRRIRAYAVSLIVSGGFHPQILAQSLRYYRPLPYPYTWFVYENQAAIVNIIDLLAYETHQESTSTYQQQLQDNSETIDDEIGVLQELNMNQINESFEQASGFVGSSGLTNKLISKNLRLTKYCEEEEDREVCVVCQVEFECNERVGVLQCKHRFHPKCIKEWLLRKNVCPLCKAQALMV